MKRERSHGSGRCYACDRGVVGLRDRRPDGGDLEPACKRHADPMIQPVWICIYCDTPTRRGSVYVDGEHAHAACQKENDA